MSRLIAGILLGIAAVTMAAGLFYTLSSLITEQDTLNQSFRENLLNHSAQCEIESRIFLQTLNLYALGDGRVNHEDIMLRFDILWSRVDIISRGPTGEQFRTFPDSEQTIEIAAASLKRIEADILELKPQDKVSVERAIQETQNLIDQFHRIYHKVVNTIGRKREQYRERLNEVYSNAIIMLFGVIVSGGFLLFLSISRQRSLNRLSANLESMVRQRTAALNDQYELLQAIIQAIPAPLYYQDKDGIYIGCNRRFETVVGVPTEQILQQHIYDLSTKEEVDTATDQKVLSTGHSFVTETQANYADGSVRDVIYHKAAFHNADGEIAGLIGVIIDISARKRNENELRKLSKAVEQSPAATIIFNEQGQIEYINPRFIEMTGYAEDVLIGSDASIFRNTTLTGDINSTPWSAARQGGTWSEEFQQLRRDNGWFWMKASLSAIRDHQDQITHYLLIGEDISQRKESEARLLQQATIDMVSGLPNRALAQDRLQQAMNNARRNNGKVGVIFIDLDHFKQINDKLGHLAGDRLLAQVSVRFRQCVRDADTVARLGGDEFLVILPGVASADSVEAVAVKIVSALKETFIIENQEIVATASLGIAVYPDDGTGTEDLLRNADTALYRAKEQGRGTYRKFNSE